MAHVTFPHERYNKRTCIVNNNKTYIFFIINLMQYKDTSQQAFLINYLICIL